MVTINTVIKTLHKLDFSQIARISLLFSLVSAIIEITDHDIIPVTNNILKLLIKYLLLIILLTITLNKLL
jgi:hypothetical protein